jgi:hypothetical protein
MPAKRVIGMVEYWRIGMIEWWLCGMERIADDIDDVFSSPKTRKPAVMRFVAIISYYFKKILEKQ